MNRLFVAAVFAALAVAFPLSAGITVDADDTLTAHVTPFATTAWIGKSRRTQGSFSTVWTPRALLTDTDRDGVVRWQPDGGVAPAGMWCLVDMTAGTMEAIRPDGSPVQRAPLLMNFLRDTAGNYSSIELRHPGSTFALMWVRPGVGAWARSAVSGTEVVHVSRMFPLALTAAPTGFRKGDIVVGVSLDEPVFFGDLVDARLDAAVTEPSTISFGSAIGNEKDGAARILLQRRGSTEHAASVRMTTSDGSATAGVHYEPFSEVVTFARGEVSRTIEIPLIDDQSWSGTRSFNVSLSHVRGATVQDPPSVKVHMTDDDPKPVIAIDSVQVLEGGSGTHHTTVPVTLTGATHLPATLGWEFSSGADWQSGELVFAPGETEKSIELAWSGDTSPNPDGSFAIRVHHVVNATATEGRLIVEDDDSAGITAEPLTVRENDGEVLLPLRLSAPRNTPTSVRYSVFDQHDIEPGSGTVTFPPGATEAYIPLSIIQDADYEKTEVIDVRLFDPSPGVVIRREFVQVSVLDDDPVPQIRINQLRELPYRENGAIWFWLTVGAQADAEFEVSIVPGTARPDQDFVPLRQRVRFIGGFSWDDTVVISLRNDAIAEPDETLTLQITHPATSTVVATQEIVVVDDDRGLPELTIEDVVVHENSALATFRISLSEPSSEPVSFRVDTRSGTAAAGSDFAMVAGVITFAPGQTSTSVDVPVLEDTDHEVQETFEVLLWEVSGGRVGKLTATGRIIDNDVDDVEWPLVTATDVTVSESATVARFEVRLNAPQAGRVSLDWTTADGSALAAADYAPRSGTLRFAPGEIVKIVEIPIVNDDTVEETETFTLRLSSSDARIANHELVCTIENDDEEPKAGRRRSARH
jgi:hypothetical protein